VGTTEVRKFRNRKGGAVSMRKALKATRDAGLTIEQKTKSSLVKLVDETTGDQITISSLDKEVTRKTAAWLRDHGVKI
jgi:hypothetical protein